MITFDHTCKSYDGTPAITDLNLHITQGELVVLLGPSGSGKSTALKMINRMVDHDGGRILLNGEEIYSFNVQDLRRRMGYAIQSVGLFPHWTVARNIATVPTLLGWDAVRVQARVTELLQLLDIPLLRDADDGPGYYVAAKGAAAGWPRSSARPRSRSCNSRPRSAGSASRSRRRWPS